MTGLVVAAAGTMFTGGNKSITSNIVGGALIGGGVTTAISSGLKSMELEKLGNSIYSAALGQTYLSIPIIRLCESLTGSNIDNDLKHNFNTVVDSWKDSVLYLINHQKRTLDEQIAKWYKTMVNHPTNEIKAFQSTLKMIGIRSNEYDIALENYLNLYNASQDKFSPSKQFVFAFAVVFVVGIVFITMSSIFKSIPEINNSVKAYITYFSSIIAGYLVYKKLMPKELKVLKASFANIKNIHITNKDFNLGIEP
jgi:hypothetical protein